MHLLVRSISFMLTLVIGAIAFAFTAIEFPGVMRELISAAGHAPAYISRLGLSDSYMVWVDVLLTGDKLVMLGFVAATRILFALVGGLFGRDNQPYRPPAEINAAASDRWPAFRRWGRG